jgi:taurine dioxygenase
MLYYIIRSQLPTKVTIVRSDIRPEGCGDTEFANTVAAYAALPSELKSKLNGLTGLYSYTTLKVTDATVVHGQESLTDTEIEKAAKFVVHPLITTHPVTGEKNLYANPSHTASVVGLSSGESRELLDTLFAATAQPQFIYRHVYRDGDLVMWDNRGMVILSVQALISCSMSPVS